MKIDMKKNDTQQPPAPVAGDQLTGEADVLKKQLDEATAQWKRALADYQNLEKRVNEERRELIQYSVKNFITELLAIVDDFEKAETHLKDPGLTLALKKLRDLLKREGVEKMEVMGKEYDIHTMEALILDEDGQDGKVLAELRTGYTMHGSVLRPAQVKVSKKKS